MIKCANGDFQDIVPESVKDFLKDDVDLAQLHIQLCMLPDMIKAAFNSSVKQVTNIRTIASAIYARIRRLSENANRS